MRISSTASPLDLPSVWDSGGIRTTLPMPPGYYRSYVNGFRPDGVALGNAEFPPQFPGPAGYWDASPFTSLPELGSGATVFDANADAFCGEVYELLPQGFYTSHPAIWTDGGVQRITGLNETNGQCDSINEAGIYVGPVDISTGANSFRRTGFIGQDGTAQLITFPNIDVIRANDINNSNRVIGHWSPDGVTRRGFISTAFEDDFQDLGVLPGFSGAAPNAINDHGAIVGSVITSTNVRALVWQPGDTHPTDLNTLVDIPGETLVEAMDINNAGQILARGFNGYYIFTPIPEPAAVGAIALAGLLLRRRTLRACCAAQ